MSICLCPVVSPPRIFYCAFMLSWRFFLFRYSLHYWSLLINTKDMFSPFRSIVNNWFLHVFQISPSCGWMWANVNEFHPFRWPWWHANVRDSGHGRPNSPCYASRNKHEPRAYLHNIPDIITPEPLRWTLQCSGKDGGHREWNGTNVLLLSQRIQANARKLLSWIDQIELLSGELLHQEKKNIVEIQPTAFLFVLVIRPSSHKTNE